MPRKQTTALLFLALVSLLTARASSAEHDHHDYRDHNEIRRLLQANKILSLEAMIAYHRQKHPGGKLLEAELESEGGRYVYELKILGDDGVVREFEYDASSTETGNPKFQQHPD